MRAIPNTAVVWGFTNRTFARVTQFSPKDLLWLGLELPLQDADVGGNSPAFELRPNVFGDYIHIENSNSRLTIFFLRNKRSPKIIRLKFIDTNIVFQFFCS